MRLSDYICDSCCCDGCYLIVSMSSENILLSEQQNEVMTGTYTQNPLISDITLALMEDTG